MPAQKLITKIFIYIFLFVLICFTSYKLYPIVSGPKIIINSTESPNTDKSIIVVSGQILRAKKVTIMDREIVLDQNGNFREAFLSQKPYNIFYIMATDKWGRNIEKRIVVNNN